MGRFGPLGRNPGGDWAGTAQVGADAGLRPAALWDGSPGPAASSAANPDEARGRDAGPSPRGAGTGDARVGGGDVTEREALAVLASVDGLGPVTLGRLVAGLGGAGATLRAAAGDGAVRVLLDAGRDAERGTGIAADVARRLVAAATEAPAILERLARAGVEIVTLADPWYPARLREIEMPPHVLFVRGDAAALGAERAVAVVGTRRPTEAGRRLAGQVGGAIAREGACVVSGLAIGVDGAAHAAAVAEGGLTVAVLGGGHGRLYPRAHARLADEICARDGAVISELPPDVPPVAGTFPRRNRLISGLSEATVVIEAGERSGALVTAAWALEQGRGCFLVPGPLGAPASAGCLAFLRECPGEARVVAGIPELLEDLDLVGRTHPTGGPRAAPGSPVGPVQARRTSAARVRQRSRPRPAGARAALAEVGETERLIARALIGGAGTIDELVARVGLPVATVLGAITLLEGRGMVTAAYGHYRPAGALLAVEPGSL